MTVILVLLGSAVAFPRGVNGMGKAAEANGTEFCPCDGSCPLGEAIRLVGGRWKIRILCALRLDGTLRYGEIKGKAAGITPAVLSSTMKELEADGLVTRVQYEEIPPRVEYTITERGAQLMPILHRLAHWAKNEPFDSDDEIPPRFQPEESFPPAQA